MQIDANRLEVTASHYTRIGGAEKIKELVSTFYQLMDELPETTGIRKMHAKSLKGSIDKLNKYLTGWMGGPQLYVQEFGHPMLRQRHFPFVISSSERDQWLICMNLSLYKTVEDAQLRLELSDAFAKIANHMINKPDL